ncbi:hypothetical protein HNO53_20725 [Billgrantia antri]|uniref:Uncharacterized protein n=1 Tax=Halomonas sulfidivorans TaxID=2733488 RepID=A0ABX7WKI0_9GAMM|nr:hypothetical protein [Halomonas sulfidivorans]QTP60923.1 hypothetical protein HNO53_20725 [Halomonas sulfidivorans]
MPAPDWENLDDFLDEEEFATAASVTRADGTVLSLSGIYEDQYLDAQLGEYRMDTERPRLWCKQADVPGVQRGDICTVDGITYDVMTAPQGDGTGMAMLDLAPRPHA